MMITRLVKNDSNVVVWPKEKWNETRDICSLISLYSEENEEGLTLIQEEGLPLEKKWQDMNIKLTIIPKKKMDKLVNWLNLKVDVMGEPIYQNVRVISLCYSKTKGANKLLEKEIMTSNELVWNRMLHQHNMSFTSLSKCERG